MYYNCICGVIMGRERGRENRWRMRLGYRIGLGIRRSCSVLVSEQWKGGGEGDVPESRVVSCSGITVRESV